MRLRDVFEPAFEVPSTRRSKSNRYFRKIESWEPPTNFYARF